MEATKIIQNQDFQAYATIEAVKMLAKDAGLDSLELMKEFVSLKNPKLNKAVGEIVAKGALILEKELK